MKGWRVPRVLRPGQVRSDPSKDIQEEIELYLDLRAQELEEQGMGPEEARRVARDRFGDPERIEQELKRQEKRRRVRRETTMTMGGLRQDVAYAIRTLRRSPGFFAVAVVTLGLALGGNTAIFSVVDAALLQALPFEDHEELVFLNGYHLVDGEVSIRGASFPEFRDWRERSRTVAPMAAVNGTSFTLTGEGEAEQVQAELVTDDYFEVLGGTPERGRLFQPDEFAEPDAAPVVILSHGFWERRYALDPSVVGSDIVLNDRPLTVIGVMPADFGGINLTTDVWVPHTMVSLNFGVGVLEERGARFLSVIGRLAPGTDIETAQSELDVIARDLQTAYPRAHEDRFSQIQAFREGYLGDTGGLLWILLGAGGVLLLIAAANVANLLLVRAHARTREFVLRRALGAQGGRVAAQLLTESIVLAVAGGVAGIAVAVLALRVLGPMIPDGVLPGYVEPAMSPKAFGFSLVILALVGVLSGLAPAASSARMDIATKLREGGRSGATGGRFRAQHLFVVAQVALALVLMVGAGLLTRSFRAQLAVDTGSDVEGVQVMRLQLPGSRFDSDEVIWTFVAELERRVAAIPGVESATVATDLPFRGGSSASYIFRQGEGADDRIRYHRHAVTPDYLGTLGVELLEGRWIGSDDVDSSAGVIVITDAMARRVYPGESAVGQIMTLRPDGGFPVEIVGVVEDVRYRDVTTSMMADANSPDVFFSFWQIPSRGIEVAARVSTGDPADVGPAMRQVVRELDPDLPIFQLEPLAVSWREQTATPRFAAFLMSLFSGLAVLLACVGIYGVLAFTVGERSREIAIRRAIGASAAEVARSVVVGGLKLAAVGLLVGAAAAWLGTGVLERFLFGVAATDPVTYLSVAGGMVAVAVVAALVPALRAMRKDPAGALGAE